MFTEPLGSAEPRLKITGLHYRPHYRPAAGYPASKPGASQTRKSGFEKYTPGLHSLIEAYHSWQCIQEQQTSQTFKAKATKHVRRTRYLSNIQ